MDEKAKDLEFYIQSILINRAVVVFCKNKKLINCLNELNVHKRWFQKNIWEIKYKTNNDLAKILNMLRIQGALFSSDPFGWGPAEVFDNLKDKGFVDGEIIRISWIGNGKYRVTTK